MLGKLKQARSQYLYGPIRRSLATRGIDVVRVDDAAQLAEPPMEGFIQPDEVMPAYEKLLATPRDTKFEPELLVDFLNSAGLAGLFIPAQGATNFKVCFVEDDRSQALTAVARFCAVEGAQLQYRLQKQSVDTRNVAQYLSDLSDVSSSVITLSSLRSTEEMRFTIEFWTDDGDYYSAGGSNLLSRRLWKDTAAKHGFFEPGLMRDFTAMLDHPHETTHNFPIDLVFTWVNSEDPEWQDLYKQHSPNVGSDGSSISRFKSRDELKYALRSWDKYAPFVRKVFIVSNCAPPTWLDMDNERLVWVPHEEILSEAELPTFSSHTIESSLHKVPGISDHFIYSNDDFFLTRQAYPDNFYFPNGIAKIRLEPYGMVNGEVNKGHPDYLNGARNANEVIGKEFGVSPTQLVTHSPIAFRKDVMNEIEAKYDDYLARTRRNKFRNIVDVAPGYLYVHYAIAGGNAVVDHTPVQLVQQNHWFKKILSELVEKKREGSGKLPLSVCLNDGADSHLNANWNTAVTTFLDDFFPDKSEFEK